MFFSSGLKIKKFSTKEPRTPRPSKMQKPVSKSSAGEVPVGFPQWDCGNNNCEVQHKFNCYKASWNHGRLQKHFWIEVNAKYAMFDSFPISYGSCQWRCSTTCWAIVPPKTAKPLAKWGSGSSCSSSDLGSTKKHCSKLAQALQWSRFSLTSIMKMKNKPNNCIMSQHLLRLMENSILKANYTNIDKNRSLFLVAKCRS